MLTRVIRIRSARSPAVGVAASEIKSGNVVVFPTETVYGIGANAMDAKACADVYRIKGRPRHKALIVLASDMEMVRSIAHVPRKYGKVLGRVWPAPLTVVLRARQSVPRIVKSDDGTVAVRIPRSSITLALIRASKVPIVAPSANPSGLRPARSGAEARRYFNGKVSLILDAGRAGNGMPSTIIDMKAMRVIRQGVFTKRQIENFFGKAKARSTSSPRRRQV